jgi:hypothetical protein
MNVKHVILNILENEVVWKKSGLCLLVSLFICISCSRVPSDADIQKVFNEHYTELNQLKDMIASETDILAIGTDKVGNFWLDQGQWTTHKPPYTSYTEKEMLSSVGLTQERYCKYLQLLESIGGHRISRNTSNKQISIHLFRMGNVSSGQTVKIVFLSDPPVSLVNDTQESISDDSGVFYSRLKGNWYIEREK